MRYQLKVFCLALSIILLLCQGSLSQQARQGQDEQVLVRVDTDLVAVDVTITDPQGNYMLDLKAEDFELIEDGTVRPIEFFQPVRTLQQSPLALVVALDLSGSLSPEEIDMQRNSIEQFI